MEVPMRPLCRRVVALIGLVLVGALALAVVPRGAAGAEPPGHTVYVSITGDGPNAKAWYAGSSPVGVAVQDALTALTAQGYRVKALVAGERPFVVTQAANPPLVPERTYVLLLER
jgi:hypothetical protein